MWKRILGYSLLALTAYIVFLLVELPASLVWRYAQPYVPMQTRQAVSAVAGTVWQGQAQWQVQGQGGVLQWSLQPWRQLLGQPILHLQMQAELGRLDALVDTGWGGEVGVDVQGKLALPALNPLFKRDRLTLAGDVTLQDVRVQLLPRQRKVLEVHGKLTWSGGTIGYPLGAEIRQQQMPALVGLLTQRGDDVVMDIKDNPVALGVAEAVVQADGLAKLSVRRKLLDLAGAPWSKNSDPQDIVFRVQQRIF